MPLTYSGVLMNQDELGPPPLFDLALAMSRMPRWAGHTRRWFSVLDHSIFAADLARQDHPTDYALHLAMLLHDAHEGLTGDVPSDLKPVELRQYQTRVDYLLFERYFPGGRKAFYAMLELVKHYDHRALAAEAYVLGPPAFATMNRIAFERLLGRPWDLDDIVRLDTLLGLHKIGQPPFMTTANEEQRIEQFVRGVELVRALATSTDAERGVGEGINTK